MYNTVDGWRIIYFGYYLNKRMEDDKINPYDKNTNRQDLINYCERLEFKLQQEKEFKKKFGLWEHYVTFLFSFLCGGAVVRTGMELLSRKGFEWYLAITILIALLPGVYLFLKEIAKR
jgi:hypothetical protein